MRGVEARVRVSEYTGIYMLMHSVPVLCMSVYGYAYIDIYIYLCICMRMYLSAYACAFDAYLWHVSA